MVGDTVDVGFGSLVAVAVVTCEASAETVALSVGVGVGGAPIEMGYLYTMGMVMGTFLMYGINVV